jgi:TrmH family RNA methyltransferase
MQSLETLVRDLKLKRGRERRGLALAEGVRLVEEALAAGVQVRAALVSPALEATPRGAALAASLRQRAPKFESLGDRALAELAATEHPQGVIVVIEPKRFALDDISLGKKGVVLVLDAVQDPGNVGTMIRTAHGLGAAGVITLPGTAELTNPKVLRASMGAAFRLPAVPAPADEALGWLAKNGAEIWAADAAGSQVPVARSPSPVALVVGNEGAGLSPQLLKAATRRVAIPLASGAESLNVGIAAGILLYEALRDA